MNIKDLEKGSYRIVPPTSSGGMMNVGDISKTTVTPPPEPTGVSGPAGVALGAIKGFVGGARDVAGMIQGLGQRSLAAITPGKSYEDIKKETGIKSISDETPEGAQIKEQLTPRGKAEKGGAIAEQVAEFVVPLGYGAIKTGSFLKNVFGKKTVQQILNTAEKDLGKLSSAEQSIYFSAKNRAITTLSTIEKQALAKVTQTKIATLQNEARILSNKVAVASRDEVLRLRPKIIQTIQKQSQEYRAIVDRELNPFKNIGVKQSELKKFVENIYANDKEMLTTMLDRLGLSGKTSNTTIGKIYKKVVSLGQDISKTAKKGGTTFTPDEKLTDDAISTLTNFLKEKGVNLSNARQFWSKWAPIRNQLVSEAKPFVQTPTLTQNFANRMIKIAQGKDVNNENYIKEVEKLLGPVGKEVRALVQNLSANQKQLVATKLEAEAKRMGIQLSTQQARATLGELKGTATLSLEQRKKVIQLLRNIALTAGVGYGAVRGGDLLFGN